MPAFFKGRNAKAGLIIPGLALALLAGFVRSLFVLDMVDLRYSRVTFSVTSRPGFITCNSHWRIDGNPEASERRFEWHAVKYRAPGENPPIHQWRFDWSFERSPEGMRLVDFGFPYWFLIGLLTLLSA